MIDRFVMRKSIALPSWWSISLWAALSMAAILKLALLAVEAVPFNADEAIVALMARHFLQGERPLFFYGQAYMGSLDAILVAMAFKITGVSVWGIRLVQILLYTGTLLTTAWLGKAVSGRWQVGMIAAWLLAIPSVSMTLYTTVSMGGYGEMLLIGNLVLLLTVAICNEDASKTTHKQLVLWFGLGFLAGFGLWVFGLSLVYSLPAMLFLAFRKSRQGIIAWGLLAMGLIIGALPWLVYAGQEGLSILLHELGGGAIASVESSGFWAQLLQHSLNFGLFGTTAILGLRPSWGIQWLVLPLAPLVLAFWVLVVVYAVKRTAGEIKRRKNSGEYSYSPLLTGVVLTLLVGFLLSPFGADPSGRYFLPITVVLTLFAAQAVWDWYGKWGRWVVIAVVLVLGFNLWGTLQMASITPPGLTTQIDAVTQIDHSYDDELINFLLVEGELTGYSNYWVAYPLAFLTDEQLVYLPRLPYHPDLRYTSRDDRYAPYQETVGKADSTAYITTNNPGLDDQLQDELSRLGVSWKEKIIGDYHVYYGLSESVAPEQIGLGMDR
jgi:4-amino-4-deoxy-L-arabinose transferase-like glycosyltransferase